MSASKPHRVLETPIAEDADPDFNLLKIGGQKKIIGVILGTII